MNIGFRKSHNRRLQSNDTSTMTSSSVIGCHLTSWRPHCHAMLRGGPQSLRWCRTRCCPYYWTQLSWRLDHSRSPALTQVHDHAELGQGWPAEAVSLSQRQGLGEIWQPRGPFWQDGGRQSLPGLAASSRGKVGSSRSAQLHGRGGS